jgi:hypothetical protein
MNTQGILDTYQVLNSIKVANYQTKTPYNIIGNDNVHLTYDIVTLKYVKGKNYFVAPSKKGHFDKSKGHFDKSKGHFDKSKGHFDKSKGKKIYGGYNSDSDESDDSDYDIGGGDYSGYQILVFS